MPQVYHLRLLPSSSPFLRFSFARSLFSKPADTCDFKPRSPLAVFCYSGRRGRGGGGDRVLPQRRGTSTLRKDRVREKGAAEMEKEGMMGYNKRRAEGRDKSDKPKMLQLKTRKLNPVNTICYVQILGTGMDTQDTSPSVLLFFDKQRFIFNAGEGLQRFCTEHKIKLSKIDHIFLTRVCSETASGLPGLLLTLAGIGEEGMMVNMWGPSDLSYLIDAMRSFIPNAAMIHAHSFGVTQNGDGMSFSSSEGVKFKDPIVLIDDEVVRISAIPVRPKYAENAMDAYIAPAESTSQFSDISASGLQSSRSEIGLSQKPGDISVIYSCELPEIKGKFDPAKAASLGLKPGPKYRELQLGNSVKSDHLDIMVHPSDVLGPSSPGPIVLLVDCPTPFHVHELLSKQSLNCYYTDSADQPRENIKSVSCIIHLGPASVTKRVDYQKWMKRFGAAQHIMAGQEIKNLEIPILKSSARISSRLNYLCPQLFPASGFVSLQQINNSPLESNRSTEGSLTPCECISAENLLKFNLRPYSQLGLDRSVIPSLLNREEIVNELLSEIPEIADVSNIVSQFWQRSADCREIISPLKVDTIMVEEPWMNETSIIPTSNLGKSGEKCPKEDNLFVDHAQRNVLKHNPDIPACLENITREDMEIVLLGTGSSQPSKYRNVSSIFVNLFSRGSLLLDCGEGTLAQLRRRFGVKGADDAVKSLKFIWISHIHADHHCGLARILALRCQLLKGVPHKPLIVIGPRPLKRFLDAYSRLEHLDMEFLDCRHTTEASMDALLGPQDTGEDWSPENSGKKDNKGAKKDNLEATLFAHSSKMQSYWKGPGSALDIAMTLPVIMRLKEMLCEAGLEALYSVPVVHCPQAFGVVLKAAKRVNSVGETCPGWKLVYSGDTRPCQALIDASLDATILIHEATFEDSMVDEAIARNHSTTEEAVGVGTSAGAYRIILTHFSQRYPKIPVFDETHMDKTCIAFDLMSVNLADLPVLPKVVPYLKILFRNETMADETDDGQEAVLY